MLSEQLKIILDKYRNFDPNEVALRLSSYGPQLNFIIQQIEGYQKSKDKLPTWHANYDIIFPVRLSLEQSSSEKTASYKANLVRGKTIVDITGGYGVDSYFFSKKFNQVVYIERFPSLFEIVKQNFETLAVKNIDCFCAEGTSFIKETHLDFDVIYIDPARRSSENRKVFLFEDCEPNILDNLPLLFAKAEWIMIKTSPLLDIDKAVLQLKYVKEVHVVAVNNECKEVLYLLQRDFIGEPQLLTVNIKQNENEVFTGSKSLEKEVGSRFLEPTKYLYEPNAAILKAGFFKLIAKQFGLNKISPNTHLYSSDQIYENFPGRIFSINLIGSEKEIFKQLKDKKANILTRNYPLSAENLKKKLKLSDGGEHYIVAFRTFEHVPRLAYCDKINKDGFKLIVVKEMIGILVPMQKEIELILTCMDVEYTVEEGRRTYYAGHLAGKNIVVALSRIGKVASAVTASFMITNFKVDQIVVLGVAGGVDANLRIGDICISTSAIQHDMDARGLFPQFEIPLLGMKYFESSPFLLQKALVASDIFINKLKLDPYFGNNNFLVNLNELKIWSGIMASGDQFIGDIEKLKSLKNSIPNLLFVEMEGAAVAQVCFEYNIQHISIRIISDNANDNAHIDFENFIENVAKHFTLGIITEYLQII